MTTFGPARWANSSSGSTAIVPSWTTASFSAAISSRVVAEHVGVLEPDVREQDDVRAEHVRRVEAPAEPGLDDGDVDSRVANSANAAAQSVSNCVASCASASGRTRPIAASKSASSPSTVIRSAHERMCGETVAPTDSPSASRNASIVRVAVDLPFVPTTWIAGYASCGSPSAASSVRIRPSPNSCGHGLRESSQAVCSA